MIYVYSIRFTLPLRIIHEFCTLGPVSQPVPQLEKMLEAGMNIGRLNFSHGSYEYHAETISNLRKAEESYSQKSGIPYSLAIALDTKGPEIRSGLLEGVSCKVRIYLWYM